MLTGFILLGGPSAASAFCGFYVSGADSELYNNATMVVMMRVGTRTVLSMQNSYQGPPQDFAMVVPVPVVLSEENVKTLPRQVFDRVDTLAAPRLVEYWEQDPCAPQVEYQRMAFATGAASMDRRSREEERGDLGVTVEAQFQVAEYDIVILSARDSSGLDTWLRREQYNIPRGAGEVLRPYVERGTKFFVAKVDVERVTFQSGRAVLSPLRMQYDTDEFSLPVRLGLLNSGGQQDLIVHILAPGQRYEVANYANTFIPTNIRVVNDVRDGFGGFYEALFRQTSASNPRTAVTEYSWDASSCDPCPTEPLNPGELLTLGADAMQGRPQSGFVLTRLHYRYSAQSLGEDLVFRQAPPMVGGRGMPDQNGEMSEQTPAADSINNFQGRYVILHKWQGATACAQPVRGQWGGPPDGREPPAAAARSALSTGGSAPPPPQNLGALVQEDIPEINVRMGITTTPSEMVVDRGPAPAAVASDGGCASCSTSPVSPALGALVLALFGWLHWRRRR
jgi:MYXO-CTERM domain-containing protein